MAEKQKDDYLRFGYETGEETLSTAGCVRTPLSLATMRLERDIHQVYTALMTVGENLIIDARKSRSEWYGQCGADLITSLDELRKAVSRLRGDLGGTSEKKVGRSAGGADELFLKWQAAINAIPVDEMCAAARGNDVPPDHQLLTDQLNRSLEGLDEFYTSVRRSWGE
ncbi:MAG: hypothetical protein ABIK65_14735 [Candidatus Eisenbacteria bacterium]